MVTPTSLVGSSSSFLDSTEPAGGTPLKAALLALAFSGVALYLVFRKTCARKSCEATPYRSLSTPSLRREAKKADSAARHTIGRKNPSVEPEQRTAQPHPKSKPSAYCQRRDSGTAAVLPARKKPSEQPRPRPLKLVRQPTLSDSQWTVVRRMRKSRTKSSQPKQETGQPQAKSSPSPHREADRASNAGAQSKKISAHSPRPGKPADNGWTTVQKKRRKKNNRPLPIAILKKKYGTLAYILYKKKWWPEKFGNPTTFFRNWMSDVRSLLDRMPYHTDRSQARAKLARLVNQLELPDQYKPDNQHFTTYNYPIDKTLLEINTPWQQLHELAKQLALIEGVAPAKKEKSS